MADHDQPDAATSDNDPGQSAQNATRVIRSEELFAGDRTIVIQHADVQYRLLITRNDRLILQK